VLAQISICIIIAQKLIWNEISEVDCGDIRAGIDGTRPQNGARRLRNCIRIRITNSGIKQTGMIAVNSKGALCSHARAAVSMRAHRFAVVLLANAIVPEHVWQKQLSETIGASTAQWLLRTSRLLLVRACLQTAVCLRGTPYVWLSVYVCFSGSIAFLQFHD
jgi:hypothetical protein